MVIDEIHNIEEKTRNALTKEINKQFISSILRDYKYVSYTHLDVYKRQILESVTS
ncbi:hypothetical protein A5885_003596 [Enterococcus sp. 8E11_MSG4843]|nr:hypothetical protein A5885_003596 [Enterococcus sp. 8E11_MSG4843]